MARELRRLFAQDEGLTIYRIIVPVAHRFPRLARIFYEEGRRRRSDRWRISSAP